MRASRYRNVRVRTAAAPFWPSYLTAGNRNTASKRCPGSQLYARHAVLVAPRHSIDRARLQLPELNPYSYSITLRHLACRGAVSCAVMCPQRQTAQCLLEPGLGCVIGAGIGMRDCRSRHSYRPYVPVHAFPFSGIAAFGVDLPSQLWLLSIVAYRCLVRRRSPALCCAGVHRDC